MWKQIGKLCFITMVATMLKIWKGSIYNKIKFIIYLIFLPIIFVLFLTLVVIEYLFFKEIVKEAINKVYDSISDLR